MAPSHLLKLYRADKHLREMEDLLQGFRDRREYPVIESTEPQRQGLVWIYRLDLTSVEPPEELPIILGDYLFNVRSALDHLAVAIAPRKRKSKASFPAFTKDPLAVDKVTGDYLDTEAADAWFLRTQGLPDDCIAHLKALQPYEAATRHNNVARDHALAILSALQNADKHRQLVGITTGLSKAEISYDGQVQGVVPVLPHGAILDRQMSKVDVKIEGSAVVGLQSGNRVWDFDMFVPKLVQFVTGEVLPRLEQFLK
jgi:hypothetical protein